MQNYFFNFAENKVMYDERKKRFIYLADATRDQKREFNQNHFKFQRPDLYGQDQNDFKKDLKYGQNYLRAIMY